MNRPDAPEYPYEESVIRYQGIAHALAMAPAEDVVLLMLALAHREREQAK